MQMRLRGPKAAWFPATRLTAVGTCGRFPRFTRQGQRLCKLDLAIAWRATSCRTPPPSSELGMSHSKGAQLDPPTAPGSSQL
jgi:hypothetical protein